MESMYSMEEDTKLNIPDDIVDEELNISGDTLELTTGAAAACDDSDTLVIGLYELS